MVLRAAVVTLLVGCGGGGSDDPGTATTVVSSTTTPTSTDTVSPRDSGSGVLPTEDTGPCIYPEVDLVSQGPTGEMDRPRYVALRFNGVGVDRAIADFASPTNGESSATYDIVFYSDAFAELCYVRYDASKAVPVNPTDWTTDSFGELYAAWQVFPQDGYSTCGLIDPFAGFGSDDLRDWIESGSADTSDTGAVPGVSLEWGFGLGQMVVVEDRLAEAVTEAGLNWVEDWAPNVFGFYVYLGGETVYELGYSFAGAHDCGVIEEVSPGVIDPLLEPLGAPMEDFYIGTQFFLIDLFPGEVPPEDTG